MNKAEYYELFKYNLYQEEISYNTAKRYYKCTVKVLNRINWITPTDIKSKDIIKILATLGSASTISSVRNGLKYFCRYFSDCKIQSLPTASSMGKITKPFMHISKRELKSMLFDAFIKGYALNRDSNLDIEEKFEGYYQALNGKYIRIK